MNEDQPSREELLAEIDNLRQQLEILRQEKFDLEILLENTTEHSDTVAAQLHEEAVEEVHRSERRLAQFLEGVSVGIFVLNNQFQPYYINQTAQQILQKKSISLENKDNISEFYQFYIASTNQLYPQAKLPVIRALLQGETCTVDDMEIHQEDKIIPIEVWATPIYDEKGKIIYAIAAFQDITQRKQAEAEKQKFTDQLFQLNKAYERFIPYQFLQLLQKESIVDVKLGDQVQKEMSVLFSDIRDFTSMSEQMTPEHNFKFINSYLSRMEPIITQYRGFIDKYIGDAIMALFSGSADDAVKAGIAMLEQL
ncbi:MAG TPA: adenylate/guanylate cyclase domain-containing protein, partial [Allocoleopsis sp.]